MKKLIDECREYISKCKESSIRRLFFKKGLSDISISEVELYMEKNKDVSFNELLFMMIDRTNQKDSEVYKRARIDRRLFSKIRSSKKYIPSKKTVIALCLALNLSIEDTNIMLASAGYSLSKSSDYDLPKNLNQKLTIIQLIHFQILKLIWILRIR